MTIQPIQTATNIPVSLIAGQVSTQLKIDPGRTLGEQAAELFQKVEAGVQQEVIKLGADEQAREAYLKQLESRREAAQARREAQREVAAARAAEREARREQAAIEDQDNHDRIRLAYTASELRAMQQQADRLNIEG
ncbi:MAG: hypothetical protein HJJLKODD_00278 [Phycisphaerae bacterium]|nr:hypothetical protein [Phycisphaerae bacterium]